MAPLDYSKFDKIDAGSGSEDEEDSKKTTGASGPAPDLFPSVNEAKAISTSAEAKATTEEEPPDDVLDFVEAARFGELADLKAALAAGVQIDARGRLGATALLMGSANGHVDVVLSLLQAGASMELGNEAGNRPLHWAALNSHVDVTKALLAGRADPNVRNEFGRRPFDEAFNRDNKDICEALAPVTDFNADAPPADQCPTGDEDDKVKKSAASTAAKLAAIVDEDGAKEGTADASSEAVKENESKQDVAEGKDEANAEPPKEEASDKPAA